MARKPGKKTLTSTRDAGRHHAGFGGGIEHEIAHTLAVHGSALGWVAHVVAVGRAGEYI